MRMQVQKSKATMETNEPNPLRRRLYKIIFDADTTAGRLFDIVLLVLILASVLVVMLETVEEVDRLYYHQFFVLEWVFTILFTIEYFFRIYSHPRPLRYIFSFYGIIDLVAILPTYLSLIVAGTQYLLVVRSLRLLRAARIFKLTRFIDAGQLLSTALRGSAVKITVFLGTVITVVVIIASILYIIESPESGFTSIPMSMYWAIVTLTTVGYGDIVPATYLGKFLASFLMILGYSIIAVPTGIVSVELANATKASLETRVCPNCHKEGHEIRANFCNNCGSRLEA
ncbi:ion transporter [soil metagenome]